MPKAASYASLTFPRLNKVRCPSAERKATIAIKLLWSPLFKRAVSKRVVNCEERRLAKTAGIALEFSSKKKQCHVQSFWKFGITTL
ncbi:hypothetical protein [Nostoc sp.]